ncbi:hypothetical protein RSOL_298710, partial [Rhizoctonia solani AG-3 Rhs1AP]
MSSSSVTYSANENMSVPLISGVDDRQISVSANDAYCYICSQDATGEANQACLSEGEPRKIDSEIAPRSKTSLALIIYHLRSLKDSAEALAQQLQAVLAALEVNVALRINVLNSTMHEAEATEIHEQWLRMPS